MNPKLLTVSITAALALAGAASAQESLPLATLAPSDGFLIKGASPTDNTGDAVGSAGDFNGDGFTDALVGARTGDPGGGNNNNAGETYIVFGSGAGPLEVDLVDPSANAIVINGINQSDGAGTEVSFAGDINNDGRTDVIIGAPLADPGGINRAGTAYVVFGRDIAAGSEIELSTLDGSDGFAITGSAELDSVGWAVSGGADVNGDEIDDVVVGAPFTSPGGVVQAGTAYVIYGRDTGFPATIAAAGITADEGLIINGAIENEEVARAVSIVGDVNGNGIADIVIGAPLALENGLRVGRAYVVYGTTRSLATLSLGSLDSSLGFTLLGDQATSNFGNQVSAAGDFDADGTDDFLVSANFEEDDAGRVYLIYGNSLAFPDLLPVADLNPGFPRPLVRGLKFEGGVRLERAGKSVAGAGDVNGDGFDDIVIGAYQASPGNIDRAGTGYLVFGYSRPRNPPAIVNLGSLAGADGMAFPGGNVDDFVGAAVSGLGDLNSDGLDDLIIGAYGLENRLNDISSGGAYVIYGNAAPMTVSSQVSMPDLFEDVGDNSGQGVAELLAPLYVDVDPFGGAAVVESPAGSSAGQWLYQGSDQIWRLVPEGLDDTNALVLEPDDRLRFDPFGDVFGAPERLRVRMWDGRWAAPGEGVDISNAVGALGGFSSDNDLINVTVNIFPVNDPPVITAQNPPIVGPDAGPQEISGWAAFSPGPPNEAGQQLQVEVESVLNPSLFASLPTVDLAGTLRYTGAPGAEGESGFFVSLSDDGGQANGGIESTDVRFTIQIRDVTFRDGFEPPLPDR